MPSNLSRIKDKIKNGELVVGTLTASSDPVISEMLCFCGFDFIWIDSEHGPIDKKDIDLHIMTVRGAGVAPFVRVPWNDPVLVKPFLDMGPAGIIFPFIKTEDEAVLAVRSCRYPPKGIRGFGPRRVHNFSKIQMDKYLEIAEKEPWVILMIEQIEAVDNLEKIVRVEGVDSILVGPDDLSSSMGLLTQTRHPDVIKVLDRIAKICIEAKIPFGAGVGSSNIDNIADWIKRGASWLLVDNDFTILTTGGTKTYETTMKLFREIKKNF
ncbi:MAG: 4-hydroxy-3-methylbut-2-en-1-yl diphosphate synthase [Actinobacteria bacterium]|nr:4-hydroxy-3-methylbut-2-en-1-yl diphosphate synthase [Actinomycetota bacterium]MBM3712002.1 4-hydroxy-3-methylbut-2-en-1-yl diphosphate synthase [Actinomycetota bacterium]